MVGALLLYSVLDPQPAVGPGRAEVGRRTAPLAGLPAAVAHLSRPAARRSARCISDDLPGLGRRRERVEPALGRHPLGEWAPQRVRHAHPVLVGLGAGTDPRARRLHAARLPVPRDAVLTPPVRLEAVELARPRTSGRLLLQRERDGLRRQPVRAGDPADRDAADVVGVHPRLALADLALAHDTRLARRRRLGRLRGRLARVVPRSEADDVPLLYDAARPVPDPRRDAGARGVAGPSRAQHP